MSFVDAAMQEWEYRLASDSLVSFAAASAFLVQLVERVDPKDWDAPGLGEWSVLELVAHANRAHTTIVDYLDHPVDLEALDSTYFTEEAIAERGRRAVETIQEDPGVAVARSARLALDRVRNTSLDHEIATPLGRLLLGTYLPSRTAELVIHGLDLARALGLAAEPPEPALLETLRFLVDRGVTKRLGSQIVLLLSGRVEAPGQFTVY